MLDGGLRERMKIVNCELETEKFRKGLLPVLELVTPSDHGSHGSRHSFKALIKCRQGLASRFRNGLGVKDAPATPMAQ